MKATQPFRKILIANRGEIAVRIIRACRELNIQTVAVYSEADRLSLHVRLADEAICIGSPPASESYLKQEKILYAAKETKAEAIHPGYGFLAENAAFAEAVDNEGLIFIGPLPNAIKLMGDKTAARKSMAKAEVPIVPGVEDAIEDEKEVTAIANKIGYPVLLKAAAGGGGKGMRVVKSEGQIYSALRAARSEAQSAFGDGRVYIEKFLEGSRHIEFQILADNHGNVVHLGERECSIQRRHQKVIEEAPSAVLDEKLRHEMGETAVRVASACGYHNAGTIEFMLDKNRNFYFLEMNTRLQVEHPVTEMVTGIDLVKEQIRIAAGEKLGYAQKDITFYGHAIECRIYAEDPANNFLPSTGKISFMQPPSGPGVREDSGYQTGSEVPIFYDPLISKLVVWGKERSEAIVRMKRALREYQLQGVESSIPFCAMVMDNKKFIAGDFDTNFIDDEFLTKPDALKKLNEADDAEHEAAVVASFLVDSQKKWRTKIPFSNSHQESRWKISGRRKQLES